MGPRRPQLALTRLTLVGPMTATVGPCTAMRGFTVAVISSTMGSNHLLVQHRLISLGMCTLFFCKTIIVGLFCGITSHNIFVIILIFLYARTFYKLWLHFLGNEKNIFVDIFYQNLYLYKFLILCVCIHYVDSKTLWFCLLCIQVDFAFWAKLCELHQLH